MQSLFESREGFKVTKPISSNSAKRYQGRNIHFFCGGRQGGGERVALGNFQGLGLGFSADLGVGQRGGGGFTPPTPFVLDFFFFL